jgi:hypothetical protein
MRVSEIGASCGGLSTVSDQACLIFVCNGSSAERLRLSSTVEGRRPPPPGTPPWPRRGYRNPAIINRRIKEPQRRFGRVCRGSMPARLEARAAMAGSNAVMAYLSQPVEKHTLLPLRPMPPGTPPWPRRGRRPWPPLGPMHAARMRDKLEGLHGNRGVCRDKP